MSIRATVSPTLPLQKMRTLLCQFCIFHLEDCVFFCNDFDLFKCHCNFVFVSGGFVCGQVIQPLGPLVNFVWGNLYKQSTLTAAQRVPNEELNEALHRPETWDHCLDTWIMKHPISSCSVGFFPLLGGCIQKKQNITDEPHSWTAAHWLHVRTTENNAK